MTFHFNEKRLTSLEVNFVREARFNIPIDESVFVLGAPAGSAIFDQRPKLESGQAISREIFDVTSVEQRREAMKPLPKELTPLEEAGLVEVKRLYSLKDGEIIKFIGPPYPSAHKLVPRLWNSRPTPHRQRSRNDLIVWDQGTWIDSHGYLGLFPPLTDVLFHILKAETTSIEGDPEILKRNLEGDFVYQANAPVEELTERLAQIVSQEWQIPIQFEFQTVKRPVFVAQGDFKLTLPEGETRVAINGGPSSGDHGEIFGSGDLPRFLTEVSNYIGVKISHQASPAKIDIPWSKRWYDLPSVPAKDKFKIDPQFVLKQVTEQTGVNFIEEQQSVRVLLVTRR